MKRIIALAFALLIISRPVKADANETISLAKLRFSLDVSQYLFDVSDVQTAAGVVRKIRIACLQGCQKAQYFEEDTGDTPLGVFRISDSVPVVISTWGTGSAYAIRIYEFGPSGIHKIFEGYSIGIPDVRAVARNEIEVVTTERARRTGPAAPTVRRAWRWKAPPGD